MVTKAIERAQTTVEQRKARDPQERPQVRRGHERAAQVIYALRDQVLDRTTCGSASSRRHCPTRSTRSSRPTASASTTKSGDVEGLITEVRTYWPSTLDAEQLKQSVSTNELYEVLMNEALYYYEAREVELTPDIMRSVERTVMLRIIDQRWRSHLYEMDYLREGINLRAMGQRDPLTEWQREGFDMFGQMMQGVWQDFIRYVMHVQVQVNRPQATPLQPGETPRLPGAAPEDQPAPVRDVTYSSPGRPVELGRRRQHGRRGPGRGGRRRAPTGRRDGRASGRHRHRHRGPRPTPQGAQSEWEKTGRNDPCPCGSGKKYKQCHGR
jgi:preprotein translocase subunit SecA